MSKHTPGPWELSAGRTVSTSSGEFYITYGSDKYGNPKFRDFCELDCNARLIAAAPDLLKACLRVMAAVDTGEIRIPAAIGIQVSAAIAKATKESA